MMTFEQLRLAVEVIKGLGDLLQDPVIRNIPKSSFLDKKFKTPVISFLF